MASVTFPTSLGGTGQTITDDADPNTGLAAGGHRVRFISALSGAVDMAATSVAKAQEAEDFKNLCQQLRDEAETFRDQASTSENNAATSATLSEDWATKLSTPVDGSEYSSKHYANEASDSAAEAAQSAASVDANNIVHAPGSGLPNEAGTAAASDVTTSATDTTSGRVMKVGDFGVGIPPSTLPAEFNSDLNTLVPLNLEAYVDGTVANRPDGNGVLVQHVARLGTAYRLHQIYYQTNDTANESRYRTYQRYYFNGLLTDWHFIYNSANILGTVSQSGGVPTGAIIERGSNANGEYVKWADGTLDIIGTNGQGATVPANAGFSFTFNLPVAVISDLSKTVVAAGITGGSVKCFISRARPENTTSISVTAANLTSSDEMLSLRYMLKSRWY